MITYAQNFEDVMLARLFRDRTEGFYVDVGAGDPVELSVTKWFYDLGWNGINIEPNQSFFQRLASMRTRDLNLNCGAGAVEDEAQYFQLSANELSSFDPDIRVRAEAGGMTVAPRTVTVLPLTSILDRHGGGRPIDFLKIDVEGWEREVLAGLDLRRHRPTVIVVEATIATTRIESHSKWEHLLTRSDYSAVYFDGLSRFYLPSERMDLDVHFQLPPNIFDGFKTWQQATNEEILATYRNEARKLSTMFADMPPALAAIDSSALGSARTDPAMDLIVIDAMRNATRTLSSAGGLLDHGLKAAIRSFRRRLAGRER